MSLLFICAIIFTIGAGLVAVPNRGELTRVGFVMEFIAALIYTISLVV